MIVATEKMVPILNKPTAGQGRVGLRRKVKCSTPPLPNKTTHKINKPITQIPESVTQLQHY